VSISAGNTQLIAGSGKVSGSPVNEADGGVEGNDCGLLIVQLKFCHNVVNGSGFNPPGSGNGGGGEFHCRFSDSNVGGAEGRHAVREDSGGEGLYGHTDCGILNRAGVVDLHTGVVSCGRGGGGGDHEGNPTRGIDVGSRSCRCVTLEAAALRKSRLGVPSGLDPASGALSNAKIDCSRVDLIDSAPSWEDEGNDLARDGISYCTVGPSDSLGSNCLGPGCRSNRIRSDNLRYTADSRGHREINLSCEEWLHQRGSESLRAAESPGRRNSHHEGRGVELRGSLLHVI